MRTCGRCGDEIERGDGYCGRCGTPAALGTPARSGPPGWLLGVLAAVLLALVTGGTWAVLGRDPGGTVEEARRPAPTAAETDAGTSGDGADDGTDGTTGSADATGDAGAATADPTTPTGAVGPTNDELARASVQVLQLDGDGQPVCYTGSGTLLDAEGTILTNFHVIENELGGECEYEQIGIAVTEDTDQPPDLRYYADALSVDPVLDLAVLRVSGRIDGQELAEELPFVQRGDSDAVEIGDELRVLGYPGIGGATISFTDGSVSGFSTAPYVEGRAWIKTDATVAGGNSGGMAVDEDGALIAVPSIVAAGDDIAAPVDCRVLQDTNDDGVLDDRDTCIPLGGFLNGLRPVNLADSLLAQAADGAEVIPVADLVGSGDGQAPPEEPGEVSTGVVTNIRFATAVGPYDEPVDDVVALPSGATRVCALFDYAGMTDGTYWDALWLVDGVLDEQVSIVGETWSGGAEGTWWFCVDEGVPLQDGLWELILYHEQEEPLATQTLFVGDDHPPVDVAVVNDTGEDVCFLQVSPSLSEQWGLDRLGPQEILGPGAETTITLGAGQYDARSLDCDGEPLSEAYDLTLEDGSVLELQP